MARSFLLQPVSACNHMNTRQRKAYSFSSTAVGTADVLALDTRTFRIMIS